MTIDNIILLVRERLARPGGRMGDFGGEPLSINRILIETLLESGQEFSEDDLLRAAKEVGVTDVEMFMTDFESWI